MAGSSADAVVVGVRVKTTTTVEARWTRARLPRGLCGDVEGGRLRLPRAVGGSRRRSRRAAGGVIET
nr:unnamed protein product [Digitaria exilis]